MAQPRLRVALDANVLIAAILLPRWPYEVMQAGLSGFFDVVLPEQVVAEARRHLTQAQQATLDALLVGSAYEELRMPSRALVQANLNLVRSEKDVPIALALLDGNADVFVTNDRDFTDAGATDGRFVREVRVMLTAVFLRDALGWSSEALEGIRYRQWDDLVANAESELGDTSSQV